MKIIPQIAVKMVEKVTESLRTTGINSIGQAINELVPIVNETVLEILKAVIEETDEILLRGTKKLRKEDGIRIKEKNIERTVLTDIGELKFRRTYFKTEDGYVYLTDQVIGIESYERITKELVAKILEAAGEVSYEKAAETTGQKVTRQTVHNRLRALKEVVTEVSKKETPKEIDIFADEDHVNIRGGKNAIVPLITITEGIDTSNEKRHKTKEPLHIAAYGMEAEALRENVLAVLCERYDLEKAEKINVHGDGAGWINNLSKALPKANLIIDGYHFEKELRSFLSLKRASGYEKRIREAFLKEDGYDDFEECIMKIRDRQETEKDIEKVDKFVSYCINRWEAIALRLNKDVCGSCTEPLVSHILSKRLSRDPLTWSKEGLKKMTMLLVYQKNGGRLSADDVRITPSTKDAHDFKKNGYLKYRDYAAKQADEMLKQNYDWSLFDKELNTFGMVDYVYLIRTSLGSPRSLVC